MSSPEDPQQRRKPSGRVRHDANGRAVWEWAVDTGRHALDSTSRLLKRLDISGLRLMADDEAPPPKQKPAQPAKPVPTFGGAPSVDPLAGSRHSFNPYDNRTPAARGVASKPPQASRPRIAQPAAGAKKAGLLSRLFGMGKT